MPSYPSFFQCRFCNYKSKLQIDVNAHTLFHHSFLMPDCSTDVATIVENYMYSKDHFINCGICRNKTIANTSPEKFKDSELLDVRNMCNYFCYNCYDIFYKGKQVAVNEDQRNKELGIKPYAVKKFNDTKNFCDGVFAYIQSIPSFKVNMYHKTLYRIHIKSKNKKIEKPKIKFKRKFINSKYYGIEKFKKIEETRID